MSGPADPTHEPHAGPAPPDEAHEDDAWASEVGRRAARRAFWLRHGERSLARNLAMIGALGWLVVTPTVGGLFVGRWLDRAFTGGIFWTGAFLVLGLGLGCWLAWRRVEDIQREDP